jgi:hypothetical protein
MGLFKRRRERESAIPPSTLEEAGADATVAEPAPEEPAAERTRTPPPAPPRTPPPPGSSIADEVAAATGGDLATQVRQLEELMAQHKVDLQSQPMEVREAVVKDLNRGGVPAKVGEGLEVTDASQVQTVISVLKKHKLLPADTNGETA